MKVSQMFPSKYLRAEDLPQGQNTIVTIEKVYPVAARSRGELDEPEVKYMMRLREFRKPMSLWPSQAKVIVQVLGTEEADDWIGQRIAIYPSTYLSWGETKPCINVDKWRPEHTTLPTAGSGLVIAGDRRPIPAEAMQRFLSHLKAQGKTWDDFLRWCKPNAPDALTLAFGVELDAIPAGVLPACKAFLDSIAPALSPPRTPGARDTVDAATGEVMPERRPAVPAAKASFPAHPDAGSVDDFDIPF